MSEQAPNKAGNEGCSITVALPKVSEREMKALRALAEYAGGDYGYLPFRSIAANSGLDLKHVRRTVRALARKGLAEYGKGLCTEDGEFAGSGYRCTHAGVVLVEFAGCSGRSAV